MTYPWWQGARDQDAGSIPVCGCCGQSLPSSIPTDVVMAIAECEFGVDRAGLTGRSQARVLIAARAFVVWALRTLNNPPPSYPEISRVLGRADHSSAINLHQKAILLRLHDRAFEGACARFSQRVRSERLQRVKKEQSHAA